MNSRYFRMIAAIVSTLAALVLHPAFADTPSRSAAPEKGASPFYCDMGALTPEVRTRHFDVLGPALVAKRTAVRELKNGYEMSFPSDAETFRQAAEYIDGERACCPFFDIRLRLTPDRGPMWLSFTGRPGTKQFIQADAAGWIKPVTARR